EDGSGAAGRVAVAAAGPVVVERAVADANRPSHVLGNAGADPGADQARHTGDPGVVVAAAGSVVGEAAVDDGESVGAKEVSAVARRDRASQAFADQGHLAAAAVAVAALGLILVERAVGDGGRGSNFIENSTPLCTSDPDDVGPDGGGIIAAE